MDFLKHFKILVSKITPTHNSCMDVVVVLTGGGGLPKQHGQFCCLFRSLCLKVLQIKFCAVFFSIAAIQMSVAEFRLPVDKFITAADMVNPEVDHIGLSVRPSVRLSVCLPVCLSLSICLCLSVCPSACLSACLSVCLSVRLSVRLSVFLSVCESTKVVLTDLFAGFKTRQILYVQKPLNTAMLWSSSWLTREAQ